MDVKIWHNPRCSKSRITLALLEEKNIAPTIIKYLETPPTEAELTELLAKLNRSPRELMRKGEAVYKDNGLDNTDLSDADLIKAMVANPILIERPIVIANNQARVGRPPESVLEIL